MFCSNCGSKLAEGARFCSVCGTRVIQAEEPEKVVRNFDLDFSEGSGDFKPAEAPLKTRVTFDWSNVIDEPQKKIIPEIRSPWATTGSIDEKELYAEMTPSTDRSRTMSFIDILRAEKEAPANNDLIYTEVLDPGYLDELPQEEPAEGPTEPAPELHFAPLYDIDEPVVTPFDNMPEEEPERPFDGPAAEEPVEEPAEEPAVEEPVEEPAPVEESAAVSEEEPAEEPEPEKKHWFEMPDFLRPATERKPFEEFVPAEEPAEEPATEEPAEEPATEEPAEEPTPADDYFSTEDEYLNISTEERVGRRNTDFEEEEPEEEPAPVAVEAPAEEPAVEPEDSLDGFEVFAGKTELEKPAQEPDFYSELREFQEVEPEPEPDIAEEYLFTENPDEAVDENALFAEMDETPAGKTGMTIAPPADRESEIEALRRRLAELLGTDSEEPETIEKEDKADLEELVAEEPVAEEPAEEPAVEEPVVEPAAEPAPELILVPEIPEEEAFREIEARLAPAAAAEEEPAVEEEPVFEEEPAEEETFEEPVYDEAGFEAELEQFMSPEEAPEEAVSDEPVWDAYLDITDEEATERFTLENRAPEEELEFEAEEELEAEEEPAAEEPEVVEEPPAEEETEEPEAYDEAPEYEAEPAMLTIDDILAAVLAEEAGPAPAVAAEDAFVAEVSEPAFEEPAPAEEPAAEAEEFSLEDYLQPEEPAAEVEEPAPFEEPVAEAEPEEPVVEERPVFTEPVVEAAAPAVEFVEPEFDLPVAEPEAVEAPVVEAPVVEAVKAEAPVVEEIKVEEPVVEEVKIEEPAAPAKETDALSIEELERDLFGESAGVEVEAEATKKIDKFYTLYRKNEEFQRLLDEEYNKLKAAGGPAPAPVIDEPEPEPAKPIEDATIYQAIDKPLEEYAKELAEKQAAETAEKAAASGTVDATVPVAATAAAADETAAPGPAVEYEEVERGGGFLTVLAVIIAILLVILLAVILILNFAENTGIALWIDSQIENIMSHFSAVGFTGEYLL